MTWFLHVDLDAFFASVEQLDNPEYRGKPVIVGGLPNEPRSVVSTASYEARKFGIHSAMPTKEAYRLCPNGIFLHGRMKRYSEISFKIMQIFSRFSPDIQQMSIDEAFIDLTGTEKLFGPPEETAMKIKQTVKDETGLTVSIGLAASKYFAKVSSGLSKPDGFYFMKPGTECEFMLHQPLDKIWGIGTKTVSRIKSAGLKTTKQIYEKNLDTLKFMFGDNTGNFLYNILRGNDMNMFSTEVKSHSISNEKTFPVDVTDIYTNETSILELSHSVMFRLLRENLRSRTICLKIRYEDFSTVSIRKTYSSDIITLDSFYEKAKLLFEEKYEKGRGIRLLGVGLENVQEETSTYQQDLFDDSEKKKQAVEKAILKFEQKHPDLQVTKARVLKPKSTILLICFFIALFSSPKIYAETKKNKSSSGAASLTTSSDFPLSLPGETPETLFDFNIKDSNVEFIASGYWQADLKGGGIFLFNKGKPLTVSFAPIVFTQDINLSTWLMINRKWYFEASFADQFAKNTVAFGYNGNGIIKSARLSNRKITFPENYSSTIFNYNPTGGDAQSPGFSMHLEKEKFQGDILIRYDMLNFRDATFYGHTNVTDTHINLCNYMSSKFFTIPEGFVTKIKDIYVENISGTYKDSNGHKFIKIDSSDYFINASKNLLILSENAISKKNNDKLLTILVTFFEDKNADEFISKIGAYENAETFLGKIQSLFSANDINLSQYSYNLKNKIENENAVTIQSQEGFSPFVDSSNYDLGLLEDSDYMIYSQSQEKIISDYLVEKNDSAILLFQNNFFAENHLYVTVFKNDQSDDSWNVEKNFPLAKTTPEIYLNKFIESDLEILVRSYSSQTTFQISQNASNVRVYKNDLLDSFAEYESDTGIVKLSQNVSEQDKIYITWNEDGNDITEGAITFAGGVKYNFLPNLKTDLSLTSSWPLLFSATSYENQKAKNGYAALTAGIDFEKNGFKIFDAASSSIENMNVTGSIIAFRSAQNIPETYFLSSNDAFVPNIKNFENDNLSLDTEKYVPTKKQTGISDNKITGFKLPLNLNSLEKNEWSALDIKLSEGSLLSQGEEFSIALKIDNPIPDIEIYLQLGVFANNENISIDERTLPVWKISDSSSENVIKSFNINLCDWQIVTVVISSQDCAKLSNYSDARLIVVSKNESQKTIGTIFAGPYEIKTKNIKTSAQPQMQVSTSATLENDSPSVKKFSYSKNYATKVSWKNNSTTNNALSFGNYFKRTDFSNYSKIEFNFKTENLNCVENVDNAFVFTLDTDAINLFTDGKIAAKLSVSTNYFKSISEKKYHTLSINIFEKTLYIDEEKVPESEFDIFINSNIIPTKFRFEINGFDEGSFYFDTLYFEKNSPHIVLQNYTEVSYKKDGDILKINERSLVKDAHITLASKQSTNIKLHTKNSSGEIQANASGGITVANIKIDAFSNFSSEMKNAFSSASHSIKTETPLFNIFSFSEEFSLDEKNKFKQKGNNVKFDFEKYNVPLNFLCNANLNISNISKNQSVEALGQFSSLYFSIKTGTKFSQKVNNIKSQNDFIENYFYGWINSFKDEFSAGDFDASKRKENFYIELEGNIPYINLYPKTNFSIEGNYNSAKENSFLNSTNVVCNFPFKIKSNNFSFTWKKSGGQEESILKGGSYKSDLDSLGKNLNSQKWYFSAMPFFDIFSINLCNQMFSKSENSASLFYSTNYKLQYKRPLFNNINDLYIPMSVNFEFERDIKATDKLSDIYQYKFSFANSFINLFGADSNKKIFNWYKQDEFSSSFQLILKSPRNNPENTSFAISVYAQTLFYINQNSSLKIASDFLIDTNSNWSERTTAIFIYPGNKTPLLSLIKIFYKNEKGLEPKISRKNIFNMEIGNESTKFFQKYDISHSCDFSFKKFFTITTSILAGYSYNENENHKILLEASIGGKMEF